MKNIFGKFAGDIIDRNRLDVSDSDFVYCLIQLPVAKYMHSKNNLMSLIANIFEISVESNGDVNQFCCDTVLVLYGVPLRHENMYSDLGKFIQRMAAIDQSLRIIIGRDQGLYGAFGFDKRIVVTAVGIGLLNDYKRLSTLEENKIYIPQNMAKVIEGIRNSNRIQFI